MVIWCICLAGGNTFPLHAFFLATTFRICILPCISLINEQKHEKISLTDKMKKFRILIITSRRMCISTMLQCMQLCIYIVHMQGVDQKYFWRWNKITHCSAVYWFNIHYTRLYFLKNWLKHIFSVFWYLLWRIVSRDPQSKVSVIGNFHDFPHLIV